MKKPTEAGDSKPQNQSGKKQITHHRLSHYKQRLDQVLPQAGLHYCRHCRQQGLKPRKFKFKGDLSAHTRKDHPDSQNQYLLKLPREIRKEKERESIQSISTSQQQFRPAWNGHRKKGRGQPAKLVKSGRPKKSTQSKSRVVETISREVSQTQYNN